MSRNISRRQRPKPCGSATELKLPRQPKPTFSDSYGKSFGIKEPRRLKKATSMSFISLGSPTERTYRQPLTPSAKSSLKIDAKRYISPEADRTLRVQDSETMNLLSQRTLELNQVILDKMQLEERMLQIQHELSVLKAENEQLRVQSIPSQEQTVPQARPTLKAGDLAWHMGSFKKKLANFVALQGSRR